MATSKLQRRLGDMLDANFPQFHIKENHRPDWLISSDKTKLELDFYIEELKIAFEVQGAQHYQFTPLFHRDMNGFEKRLRLDQEKKDLCYGRGIRLIEIFTETDAIIAVKEIIEKHMPAKDTSKYSYQDCEPTRDDALDFYKKRREKEKANKIRVDVARRNTIAKGGVWPPPKKKG